MFCMLCTTSLWYNTSFLFLCNIQWFLAYTFTRVTAMSIVVKRATKTSWTRTIRCTRPSHLCFVFRRLYTVSLTLDSACRLPVPAPVERSYIFYTASNCTRRLVRALYKILEPHAWQIIGCRNSTTFLWPQFPQMYFCCVFFTVLLFWFDPAGFGGMVLILEIFNVSASATLFGSEQSMGLEYPRYECIAWMSCCGVCVTAGSSSRKKK